MTERQKRERIKLLKRNLERRDMSRQIPAKVSLTKAERADRVRKNLEKARESRRGYRGSPRPVNTSCWVVGSDGELQKVD